MANLLEQQQLQGMITSAIGSAPTTQEQILNQLLNKGSAPLQDGGGLLGSILGAFGIGGSNSTPTFNYGSATPAQIDYSTGATPEQIAAAAAWGNSYE